MTAVYVDEELLRSARALAARTDREVREVLEEALRRYLGSAHAAEGRQPRGLDLREVLTARDGGGCADRPLPGAPNEEAEELPEGASLSEAVLAEREEIDY